MTNKRKPSSENDSPEPNSTETSDGSEGSLTPWESQRRRLYGTDKPCPPLQAGESGGNNVPTIAFQQNQRDEVRIIGEVAGALQAEPGAKQQNYVMFVDKKVSAGDQLSLLSTSSAEGSPARISAWPENVLAWLASDQDCGTSSIALLVNSLPVGFSSRTSLVCCPVTKERTSPSYLEASAETGPKSPKEAGETAGLSRQRRATITEPPGGCLTLNTSEFPRGGVACSLSDVLETSGPHLTRYFLSALACRGILRRAAKRGRVLPPALLAALTARVKADTQDDDKRTT